jgi:hypothetical protein
MVDLEHLSPYEPLSPELVLVMPPELRAEALAGLGPPVWPKPRRPRVVPAAPVAEVRFARSVGQLLATRALQLGVIFVFVTLLTLALSIVAQAFR